MNNRALAFWVRVVVVGVLLGLGGAVLATSAGSARSVERPQTLFAGSRRIYAFALGARSITWTSRTRRRGRFPGCGMYVRTLRTGRTLRAPLPSAGCGVKPSRVFAPQAPVLASGVAAWVRGASCGNIECFWKIATISGGEATARVVANVDVGCLYTCGLADFMAASPVPAPFPRPALAGAGNLLVYSTGTKTHQVRRIVGRHIVPFAVPPGLGDIGDIESLVVGGGAVEVVSDVLDAGDGCGCLDSPMWSPDGSRIAYLHGRFSNQKVDPYQPSAAPAVMNADGSARHDLSPTNRANEGPVWSPDGKQLAYGETSSTFPYPEAIPVANADGSGAHEIGLGDSPTWSPDGSKIAFASAGCASTTAAISVMKPDGTSVQQLASFAPGPTCLGDGGIAWSPDGTRIAFSLNGVLELMNADGSNRHPLGSDTVGDEPAWSPDSSQIVFHTDSGLWVIGADGSGLHQLTNGPDEHPSWSPDGKTIVFGSDRNDPYANANAGYGGAFPELYLVAPDGSNLRPLSFTKPSAFVLEDTFYSASGRLLPSLPGVPTLAGNIAAVGSTNPSGGHQITLFDATTGAQLEVVRVEASHGGFAVAGANTHWVVFHVGRAISAVNTRSHKVIRLTRAAATPLDLSVSGRRVAWAENIYGLGRIRALELPS